MSKIFISYSHRNEDVAKEIVAFLEKNGSRCYIDYRDIDPGKNYASQLTRAIGDCDHVVLIASSAMNGSSYMLNELDIIVEKNKHLVPFFIEEFEMDDDFRFYLGRAQRIIAYPDKPSTYFTRLARALNIEVSAERAPERTEALPSNTKKIFDYIPARGIMINPEDRERNVSFRTDTFINLLGGIYDKVNALNSDEQAREIFHSSGYASGKSFAQRLNSQWDMLSDSAPDYAEKLKKWCDFDSDVGWGRFSSEIEINEETGEFKGTLKINESFIVDRRGGRPVCEFVRGYCEGVIETLLNAGVELKCVKCPLKNRFSSVCEFEIVLVD